MEMYRQLAIPDYQHVSQCWMLLEDATAVAGLLGELVQSEDVDKVRSFRCPVQGCLAHKKTPTP